MYLTDCSLLESIIEENQCICSVGLLELDTDVEYAEEVTWFLDGELVSSESNWSYLPEVVGEKLI